MGDSDESPDRRHAPGWAELEAELVRYLPGLRAFLRLRMGPELRAKESVSDLVQSTCRDLLQHADRYQHRSEASFRQWLFKTAERKLANKVEYYRAGKREVGRELSESARAASDHDLARIYQTLSTPSRAVMQRELIDQLEAAFEKLDEPHREVILLKRLVGLSHEEIAREMGRSVEATRSLLYRALAELTELVPWSHPGDT